MSEAILTADFHLAFKTFNLHFSTEIDPGFTALFGPSGCGKTTTLKCLSGIQKPDSGEIKFANDLLFSSERIHFVRPENRNIGHVFQDSRLFPHMSVVQNLKFGYELTEPGKRRFAFDDIVELLNVSTLLNRNPASLSGGEGQRVAIGRALLASPHLLLLDEPMAAIDQPTKISLLTALKEIHRQFDLPIVYVSHDISTVLNIATRVILMRAGGIEAVGEPFAVLGDYVSSGLYQENALQNIFKAKITGLDKKSGTCTVQHGQIIFTLPLIDAQPGDELYLDIPASEIIVASESPSGLSARNIVPGFIKNIQHVGRRVFVEVDAGMSVKVEIVDQTVNSLRLKPGKKVFLIMKATAFRRVN